MNAPMVIKATFSDIQPVKTRGVVKFIFEVPVEGADDALKLLGGMPRSQDERWCAIARLVDDIASPDIRSTMPLPHPRERRAFYDLSMPQQAGIRSNDLHFQLWMSGNYSGVGDGDCASAIREYCGVKSRAEILPGTAAGDRWLTLLREFEGVR